ncbi:MAG: CHRD domain-containing protein [Thermoleophilia bacterium]|nr:CHRD domain-containing protein [Thermoleophilia bacterium]
MQKQIFAIVGIAAAFAFAATSVSAGQTRTNADTLRIGFLGSLSGAGSSLGQPNQLGALAAIKRINDAGGVSGRLLELVSRDTKGDPTLAIDVARELSSDSSILAIFGPDFSSNVRAALPVLNAAKIASYWSTPVLTPVAGRDSFEFAGFNAQEDTYRIGLSWAAQRKGIKKIGILAANDTTGEAGLGSLRKVAPDYGIEIVAVERFDLTAVDVTPQIQKIVSASAQLMATVVTGSAFGVVLRGVNQLGLRYKLPIFGSTGTCTLALKDIVKGVEPGLYVCPTQKAPLWQSLPANDPQLPELTKLAAAIGGDKISINSALGWDVMHLYAQAMTLAAKGGSITRQSIRDALASGTIKFNGADNNYRLTEADHRGIAYSDLALVQSTKEGTVLKAIATGEFRLVSTPFLGPAGSAPLGSFVASLARTGGFTEAQGGDLKWTLTFKGLTGSALTAELRVGTAAGAAGPVLVPLCKPCKDGQSGTTKIPGKAVLQLLSGGRSQVYVAINTQTAPTGALRGQIVLAK